MFNKLYRIREDNSVQVEQELHRHQPGPIAVEVGEEEDIGLLVQS